MLESARGAACTGAPRMTIAYAAYTEGCTFLLDEQGVCRRAVPKRARSGERTFAGRTVAEAARRCVGAQYVASIDVREAGALVPRPRVGASMLFAYVGEGGRIAVVRTGPLLRFEDLTEPSPAEAHDSGVREMPEDSERSDGLGVAPLFDEDDDAQLTVPFRQSGECPVPPPPWPPTGAPRSGAPPPPWATPAPRHVRLQRVSVVASHESGPTLERPPAGRGMLPRRRA